MVTVAAYLHQLQELQFVTQEDVVELHQGATGFCFGFLGVNGAGALDAHGVD